MTATGIITMTLILVFVWGGFGWLVNMAMRRERDKDASAGS